MIIYELRLEGGKWGPRTEVAITISSVKKAWLPVEYRFTVLAQDLTSKH